MLLILMSVVWNFAVLVCCIVYNRECVGCKLHFDEGLAIIMENQ